MPAHTILVLLTMAKYKELVDKALALLHQRKVLSMAELPYLLDVSPDYAMKVARTACTIEDVLVQRRSWDLEHHSWKSGSVLVLGSESDRWLVDMAAHGEIKESELPPRLRQKGAGA